MAINTTSLYVSLPVSQALTKYATPDYIAADVFPIIRHNKQEGFIYNADPNRDYQAERDTQRAAGTVPNKFTAGDPTQTAFYAQDYALEAVIPDEALAQSDDILIGTVIPQTAVVLDNLLLQREIKLVDAVSTVSNATPAVKWNAALGDAVSNIVAQFDAIEAAQGIRPNAIAMSSLVARKIVLSASFRSQFQFNFNSNNIVSTNRFNSSAYKAAIGTALDIAPENVCISNAYKKTSEIGSAATMASVWNQNVLLFVKNNPQAGRAGMQNLGIHAVWQGGIGQDVIVKTMRDDRASATVYQVHMYYDQLLTNATAGYLFTSVLA